MPFSCEGNARHFCRVTNNVIQQNKIMSSHRLTQLMKARKRVLLVGPPGCAKSARIFASSKDAGFKVIIFRTSLAERVDLGGCLIPDVASGLTRSLPLELLHGLRNATEPTLFVLDDLGQAPIDVQASAMSLFDPGALPDCVLIWGATNRPGDKAGVTALCEPLRSRFHLAFAIATPGNEEKADGASMLGTWKDEVDGWCEWALSDEIAAPAEVVAWHRSTTGRTLYSWKPHADPGVRMPDFRSWQTVCELWKLGITDLSTVAAAIGKPAAAEFLAFARLADQLPTPDQVWMDPKGAPVPTDPSACYLSATMLAQAVTDKHAGAFVQYCDRMGRVFCALAAKDAFRRLGAKLSGNRHWAEWWNRNQELFAVSK